MGSRDPGSAGAWGLRQLQLCALVSPGLGFQVSFNSFPSQALVLAVVVLENKMPITPTPSQTPLPSPGLDFLTCNMRKQDKMAYGSQLRCWKGLWSPSSARTSVSWEALPSPRPTLLLVFVFLLLVCDVCPSNFQACMEAGLDPLIIS